MPGYVVRGPSQAQQGRVFAGGMPIISIFDYTPPSVSAGSPSVAKISRVAGKDATNVSFTVDEDCQAWMIRLVSSNSDPYTYGTLIESGGALTSGVPQDVEITDDELVAAGGAEGSNLVKIFAQDTAGNWSP